MATVCQRDGAPEMDFGAGLACLSLVLIPALWKPILSQPCDLSDKVTTFDNGCLWHSARSKRDLLERDGQCASASVRPV